MLSIGINNIPLPPRSRKYRSAFVFVSGSIGAWRRVLAQTRLLRRHKGHGLALKGSGMGEGREESEHAVEPKYLILLDREVD